MTQRKPTRWARLWRGVDPVTRRMLVVALAVLALDRAIKWWVVEAMDLAHLGRIEVWPPFLNLVMAWNRGINFGIGAGGPEVMRWLLLGLAVAISAALALWVRRRAARAGAGPAMPLAWGAGIVIGGALGNALDRLIYGAVADFLNMSCCGIANPYAFNVADVAIFAGAALIAWKA
ncbi:MAG TPA: signal peptidase II [Thermohalobaculum sp.]|nr:signal peptidase II [Thermohalobaculum sp.]